MRRARYAFGLKYVIVIADGAGDLPIAELGGKTPLQAAATPTMDGLARSGRLATARTTPAGWAAGSDVCTMCLLGYDPVRYHTGRAPLEAAASGVQAGASDWIFRLNLVTVGPDDAGSPDSGLMLDHSAGAISDAEAAAIVPDLLAHWRRDVPELAERLTLRHGVSYRSILVDASGRRFDGVVCTPPHEVPRQPWAAHLPRAARDDRDDAEAAEFLRELMLSAREFLPGHAVNVARRAKGLREANMAWIWGQGTKPDMPSFESRFGLRGAMLTPVDLLRGIAALIGWDRLEPPGMTSYHDNDYAAQGRWACDAIDRYDIVCCHVESPDESSHQGDWRTKVAGIEAIDREVVAPIVAKLRSLSPRVGRGTGANAGADDGWRLMILPDHYTLVSTRKHDATPVPVLLAGQGFAAPRPALAYAEAEAAASDLHIAHGHELMEFFLRHALPDPRRG